MIPETIFPVTHAPVCRIHRARHARHGRPHYWVLVTPLFELTYATWEDARFASQYVVAIGPRAIPGYGLVNARRRA